VAEFIVTEFTLAEADEAMPPDRAWISAANFCPFCSSEMRFAVGVDGSKNASQLALIVAVVADEPPPVLADELLPAGAAVEVAGAAVEVVGVVLEVVELLEQAVTATASARPSAGARKIRRAM
jgi:hypothetical protein